MFSMLHGCYFVKTSIGVCRVKTPIAHLKYRPVAMRYVGLPQVPSLHAQKIAAGSLPSRKAARKPQASHLEQAWH